MINLHHLYNLVTNPRDFKVVMNISYPSYRNAFFYLKKRSIQQYITYSFFLSKAVQQQDAGSTPKQTMVSGPGS